MDLIDWLFLVFTISCMLLVVWGLMRNGLPMTKFTLILVAWAAVSAALSLSGFLSDFSTFPPRMMIVLLVPLLIVLFFTFSARSDIFLKKIPAAWIVYMQSFRVVVELFLWWAFLDELLPRQMTFEGRNFDVLAGLTAPIVAVLWLGYHRRKPILVIIWNVLGLVLLFNIVIIALLSMPTPARFFMNEPANTLVATFPWVWLPALLVILALALHLLSIKQMLMELQRRKIPAGLETGDL